MGPLRSKVCEWGITPERPTSPGVGIRPVMPQRDAGTRIEPPVSVPMLAGTMPAAIAAAEPLEEPPVTRVRFQGFRGGGQGRSNDGPPWANSKSASLPISSAPASCSFRVTAASRAGTLSASTLECAVVGMPAVLKQSLSAKGMPCSGPR